MKGWTSEFLKKGTEKKIVPTQKLTKKQELALKNPKDPREVNYID